MLTLSQSSQLLYEQKPSIVLCKSCFDKIKDRLHNVSDVIAREQIEELLDHYDKQRKNGKDKDHKGI